VCSFLLALCVSLKSNAWWMTCFCPQPYTCVSPYPWPPVSNRIKNKTKTAFNPSAMSPDTPRHGGHHSSHTAEQTEQTKTDTHHCARNQNTHRYLCRCFCRCSKPFARVSRSYKSRCEADHNIHTHTLTSMHTLQNKASPRMLVIVANNQIMNCDK
jgi:hypothetical protein